MLRQLNAYLKKNCSQKKIYLEKLRSSITEAYRITCDLFVLDSYLVNEIKTLNNRLVQPLNSVYLYCLNK